MRATASFTVDTFEPVGEPDGSIASALLTKTFTGDVEATSTVRMLTVDQTAYVAVERITGSVQGRKGSFVLLHTATQEEARWQVVAGSGTDELAGLTGTAVLTRHEDGSHTFTLDYEI
ncbi:DUF3224 domain-containing protein [Cryptosporangium sp. NPDC048952]|uniref:DUF3224 domain-containing protein n=1 Tax=Cryptosporangium sp. NPDC048952 TaxID=3363961 RepID=UPI00371AD85B